MPAFQIGDGRCFVLFVRPVEDKKSEETRPCRFEHGPGIRQELNLMFVAFVVRRATQFGWRIPEVETCFPGVTVEDSDFLEVMGRTALKARNCFAAASELFNVCFERDSRRKLAWFMGRH